MGTILLTILAASGGALTHGPSEPAPLPALPGVEQVPWDPLVMESCGAELAAAGVTDFTFLRRQEVERLPSARHGDMYCYVPQPLHYRRGPGDIKYSSYLMLSCRMAVALARFEKIVQETAARELGMGKVVTHIGILGAYNCRRLRKRPKFQSQHSFGNAIDIASFKVRGFGTIVIDEHWWNHRTRWNRTASRFLMSLVTRLREENVFTHVLSPTFDALHDNHLHLDKAPFKDLHTLDHVELTVPSAPKGPERPAPRIIAEPQWDLPEQPHPDER